MYLKEIKISGFKSFADKIHLNLDDKITCIVGPNGSGKSNIVDAVRWVLGEQSIKSLRGDNTMTDVIFSGSKSRNPLNLASVTLLFDNNDSFIKTPYTEISVTRKVYKSGENEYYINNEKCRLKDITDLFIDSGMGKESFNIISQGEIGRIISDSSSDRRSIFEETAGVLKYKKRKEEALHKLDKTNENLNRINDIIKELNEQIEPLKEQSKQATSYLELKEKLESIEISLITYDLEKINFDYQKEKEKIDSVQNDLIALSTDTSTNDIELEIKKENINKLQNLLVELNQEMLKLVKEEEHLNGEKKMIKERSKYKKEDSKLHENIVNLTESELKLNNEIISLTKDIALLEDEKNSSIAESNDKKQELVKLVDQKNKLNNEVYSKNKKAIEISYKIKNLEDYINSGASTSPSVKRVLNNPKLTGIHNTIANLLEVSDEYRLPLEIALGGAKDYVVVDNPTSAKKSINYLKENNLGRVTFYPLDVIKPRSIDPSVLSDIKNNVCYIGILADLVKYDSKYHNIIYNQLGSVIVVKDIDTANLIARQINNKYKIVTLSGEIINVGGSITGGSTKANRSVISEKYELQNSIKEEAALKKEIDDLNNQLDLISNEEISKRKEFLEIANNDIRIDGELANQKKLYDQACEKHKDVLKELEDLNIVINGGISSEEDAIIKQYYEVLNKKDDIKKQITLLTTKKEKEESLVEEMQAKYRLNNSKIRELESMLKDSEINVSKMEVKMDNLLAILTETYNMTFEKAKANYILELEPDIARKQVNHCKNEIKALGTVNIGAIEEYKRVNTRYEFLTSQSNDLNKAMDTLLSIIEELDKVMKEQFVKTFKNVAVEFEKTFKHLFGGGTATLKLTDPSNVLETGVDIVVSPPGKMLSTISLLSGGEKALTAISLLFAILNVKQVPFCLFDEVEAALDEANVDNFGKYLETYKNKTQFLIITHKKKTMEYADTLYGITMQESGVSKLVSVKLMEN